MTKYVLVLIFFIVSISTFAQTEEQKKTLKAFAEYLKQEDQKNYEKAVALAVAKKWPLEMQLANGGIMKLVGVYPNGLPEYLATESNVGAANTTGASRLWNGGTSNLNLTGSAAIMAGKLAIWDGGALLTNHQELVGRILSGDGATTLSDHATHVAGTMVAKGIVNNAKGMAYNIPNLTAFDFSNDNSEMAANAGNFLLSNHSYGAISGWRFNSVWEFWGEFTATEDYKFGYYDSKSRYWDSLAVLAPNYLIVKSAGNNRNQNGPAIGANFSRYNAAGVMTAQGAYTGGISRNDSYDILPTSAVAKNILTVGAISILNNGYAGANSVQISSFSSYGPTDDGRIKPDIVAAGVNLFSSIATGTNAYDTYSGTSMSSPNATGSLLLLQELYQRETAGFMRSATLKGLAIHTADEAGAANGPDYIYGWGLLDVDQAAQTIMGRNTTHRILQNTLNQGSNFSLNTISSGGSKLMATIVWTDPHAAFETTNYLNNRTPKLINDLDLRIVSSAGTEMPWKLDVNNPASPATKGDNILDNVEKVEIIDPIPGETYEIRVAHKGTLVNTSQNYSLLLSGVGGTAYCTSQPNSNSNSRINNFTYAGINANGTGCTQYVNSGSTFASTFPTQVNTFSLTLGTCGSNLDKMAKIFIDWNGDGDFLDANELCATSGVINGTAAFTGSITTPSNVVIGASTRIRIVLSETTNAVSIVPCGTYAFGETRDFSIKFSQAARDGRITAIILPESGSCANDATFVSATIQNSGTSAINNIPVKAIILDGATTVATLLDTLFNTIQPNGFGTVYFRNTFNALAGKTYTLKVNTDVNLEDVRFNDTLSVTKTIAAANTATITNASGQLCTATQANLTSTAPIGNTVYWYTSSTSNTPIGNGSSTIVNNNIPANNTFFVGINDAKGNVGPVTKESLSSTGGYAVFTNVQNITVHTPILIESSRMYFGNAGTITAIVREAVSGNIVDQVTVNVLPTTTIPGPTTTTWDANDTGRIVPLNLKIPAAGNYTLGISAGGGATAFRSSGFATNPYPFTVNSLMSINNSNNGTGLTTYYWFYNLKVKALGCTNNSSRVTVVAGAVLTPTISQNSNVLTSSATGTSYVWSKDGVQISNSNNVSLAITAAGSYTVEVTKGGCVFTSAPFTAIITSIQNISATEINLTLTPNPAKEKTELRFTTPKRENVTMDILSINGTKISSERFVVQPNIMFTKLIDISKLSAGIYTVRLYFNNKQVIKKLIISK